jgi:uncharacterized protein YuzE
MKLHYDPETGSLSFERKPGPGAERREGVDGLNVELDASGEVVGLDFDLASKRFDLARLETMSLPLTKTAAA